MKILYNYKVREASLPEGMTIEDLDSYLDAASIKREYSNIKELEKAFLTLERKFGKNLLGIRFDIEMKLTFDGIVNKKQNFRKEWHFRHQKDNDYE